MQSAYTIKFNDFWNKWQVGNPEIAPVVAEFNTEEEAKQYVLSAQGAVSYANV